MNSESYKKIFSEHKIISSDCKSWYVGKPGTNKNSFSVTWSPGAVILYGEKGNVTLIFAKFGTYESAKHWFSNCSFEEFKSAIAHEHPENLDFFYQALKHWGAEKHYL